MNDATVVTGNVDRSACVGSDAVGPELVSLRLVATASSSASSSPTSAIRDVSASVSRALTEAFLADEIWKKASAWVK